MRREDRAARVSPLGTATAHIPAACAARKPLGESSNTRHDSAARRTGALRAGRDPEPASPLSRRHACRRASKASSRSCRSSHGRTHAASLLEATRDLESHRPGFGQPLRDARQQRLGFAAAPMLAADPVAPAIASDGAAAPATEVRVGVESALSAERMLPVLESERRRHAGRRSPARFRTAAFRCR